MTPGRRHRRNLVVHRLYRPRGSEGVTLEERVQQTVRETGYAFVPERALRLLEQLTEGLSEIHASGVIHRDLSWPPRR